MGRPDWCEYLALQLLGVWNYRTAEAPGISNQSGNC